MSSVIILALILTQCLAGEISLGTVKQNFLPSVAFNSATHQVALDANWRWLRQAPGYTNCYDNGWKSTSNCVLEGGGTEEEMLKTYGLSSGLTLRFKSGSNIGSRLYLLNKDKDDYERFNLQNLNLSFTVDVSRMPCSVNAAVYLSYMPRIPSTQKATAQYGLGYCDAQAPTDIKYYPSGSGWSTNESKRPSGCSEIDILESNSFAQQWAIHPCKGSTCDKAGAEFNHYRNGNTAAYGPGRTINTEKPFQLNFYVRNGSMTQELMQGSKSISSTITDASAAAQHKKYNEPDKFNELGGLAALPQDGWVLVISIWDDVSSKMRWMDSVMGSGAGSVRGPCSTTYNDPRNRPEGEILFKISSISTSTELPVELPTELPTPTPAPTTPTPKPSSGKAKVYGQCGGKGWSGPNECEQITCVYGNEYYSQCRGSS